MAMPDVHALIEPIRRLHERIRDAVVEIAERASVEELSQVTKEEEGDTIYAVDEVSEAVLIRELGEQIAAESPVVLIAEGLPGGGKLVLPEGTAEADAVWRVIVDPIDGTRGLMYQKRPAWVLTGVAPNHGPDTSLQQIELAVQTELPLVKQHLSDQLWAVRGEPVHAERYNRLTGERRAFTPTPSTATTIAQGFVSLSRFFPGVRDELAAIEDHMIRLALGVAPPGKAHCFEDQYIATAGQFYELMNGRDRFVADLRPLMKPELARRGLPPTLCAYPYDVCTELLARQLGVIITDPRGRPLDPPLDVETEVSWVGYANATIREQIEPLLRGALRHRSLIPA
jgi:fructose-1,6-bisphosphatase/inositol monophosphatase family enzyme